MSNTNSAFIFKKWENRLPYYALMKLDEPKICALEVTWASARKKSVRATLLATFGGGWASVRKEASTQTLKFGGRKALGCVSGIVCGYFGSVSIILITKSAKIVKCAKICHSACSAGLDVLELCASAPINILEIGIFGRPVMIEGEGFDLFSNHPDPLDDVEKL